MKPSTSVRRSAFRRSTACAVGPATSRPRSPSRSLDTRRRAGPPRPAPTSLERWWTAFNDPIARSASSRAAIAGQPRSQDRRGADPRSARGARDRGLGSDCRRSATRAAYSRAQRSDAVPPFEVGSRARARPSVRGSRTRSRPGSMPSWEIDVFGGVRRDKEAAAGAGPGGRGRPARRPRHAARPTSHGTTWSCAGRSGSSRSSSRRCARSSDTLELGRGAIRRRAGDRARRRAGRGSSPGHERGRRPDPGAAGPSSASTASASSSAGTRARWLRSCEEPGRHPARASRGSREPSRPSSCRAGPTCGGPSGSWPRPRPAIGVARADLFPRFSIIGGFGRRSEDAGDLGSRHAASSGG